MIFTGLASICMSVCLRFVPSSFCPEKYLRRICACCTNILSKGSCSCWRFHTIKWDLVTHGVVFGPGQKSALTPAGPTREQQAFRPLLLVKTIRAKSGQNNTIINKGNVYAGWPIYVDRASWIAEASSNRTYTWQMTSCEENERIIFIEGIIQLSKCGQISCLLIPLGKKKLCSEAIIWSVISHQWPWQCLWLSFHRGPHLIGCVSVKLNLIVLSHA